jgi:hypothetical protein
VSRTDPRVPSDDSSVLTVNQIVAYNLFRARRMHGWGQARFGEMLAPHLGRAWSVATVSAAERSFSSGRTRKFDANEIVAFSVIFALPISWFFLPPDGADDQGAGYAAADGPAEILSRQDLCEAIEPFYLPDEFVGRLKRLLAESHITIEYGARKKQDWISAEQAGTRTRLFKTFGVDFEEEPGPTGASTTIMPGAIGTHDGEDDS